MKFPVLIIFVLVLRARVYANDLEEYDYDDEGRRGILLNAIAKIGKGLIDAPVRAINYGANVAKKVIDLSVHTVDTILKIPVNIIRQDGGVQRDIMDIPAEALKVSAEFLEEIRHEKIRPMFLSRQKIRKVVLLGAGTLIFLSSIDNRGPQGIEVAEDYEEDYY